MYIRLKIKKHPGAVSEGSSGAERGCRGRERGRYKNELSGVVKLLDGEVLPALYIRRIKRTGQYLYTCLAPRSS